MKNANIEYEYSQNINGNISDRNPLKLGYMS